MAPMTRQDTLDLLDDILGVNFDEIKELATSEENYGNHHLVGAESQPSVVLQPANPEVTPTLDKPIMAQGEDFLFDSSKLSEDNGLDTSLYPASPLHMPSEFSLDLNTQPASPEFIVMQNAIPESLSHQALSPVADPEQTLSSVPFSSLYLDLSQLSTSPEALTGAAISNMMTPSHEALTVAATSNIMTPSPEALTVAATSNMMTPSPEVLTTSSSSSCMLSPSSMVKEEKEPVTQPPVDAPKKRGRKRKYPVGMAPSYRHPKMPKVYQLGPLDDEKEEKKRKNAVNAKKHRDAQKAEKQKLSLELEQTKAERDQLEKLVNQFKQREEQLLQVLRVFGLETNSLHSTLEGL